MKIYQHKLKKGDERNEQKKKKKKLGPMAFNCEIKTKYYILPITLLFNR